MAEKDVQVLVNSIEFPSVLCLVLFSTLFFSCNDSI